MNVTDEGALLVLVNRHNNNYDGNICKNASTYTKCGAQEYFRKNYCSRGTKDCMDMNLFAPEKPYIFKRIHEESEKKIFEKQRSLIADGYNPIIFFHTSRQQGSVRKYYIVGAYVVKAIDIIPYAYERFDVNIYPERFIRLPMDVMKNDDLWGESTPSDSQWARCVYKAAVISSMEEMARATELADGNEYDQSHSIAREVIEAFNSSIAEQIPETMRVEKDAKEAKEASKDESKDLTLISDSRTVHAIAVLDNVKQKFDEQVNGVRKIAANAGFYYSEKMIRTICSSLEVNPLLVLAGISGSGKSSLATFYAQAINGKLEVVSVRPDWTNPSDLLGVYNPFEKDFVATPVAKFIYQAQLEWDTALKENREAQPYVLLLDEMNLARVEYYFSDFLSKMQMPIADMRVLELYNEKQGEYPKKVRLTPNLKIIGTVNIDETTFLFSPKVLDRASYINLNDIDINGLGEVIDRRGDELHNLNVIQELVLPELQNLNFKLNEFGQPFGYRTVWDIVKWVDYSLAVGNISDVYEGVDCQVESRVLVKIVDSGKAPLLNSLKGYFGDRTQKDSKLPIYEKCQQRLDELINRVMRDEYAVGQQY